MPLDFSFTSPECPTFWSKTSSCIYGGPLSPYDLVVKPPKDNLTTFRNFFRQIQLIAGTVKLKGLIWTCAELSSKGVSSSA